MSTRKTFTDAWGGTWDLEEDRAGAWPTPELIKRQHLERVHQELDDLKAAAEDQKMQEEWAQMYPENGR